MSKAPRKTAGGTPVTDQGIASWIEQLNHEGHIPLHEALDALQSSLDHQDQALADALSEIAWVRERIGSPEHILGNERTKHGEIAEMAEVAVRRARDLVAGNSPASQWYGTDRFGPADYNVDGFDVQSKFINGVNKGLQHVLDHVDTYPEFATAPDAYYHIPQDQYDVIQNIRAGSTDGYNSRTVRAVLDKVNQIESTGRSFEDIVRPASRDYTEVQHGNIKQTLDRHEVDLEARNTARRDEIVEKQRDTIRQAEQQTAPSWAEAGKVAAVGAAVGVSVQLTMGIYQKWRVEGKSPTQFTGDDWLELGGSTLSAAATGCISAASIYGITNYSTLGAPFAAAVVSSGRAVASLARQYSKGTISFEDFSELSVIATAEAGIVATGAILGNILIPIPIVGHVLGSAIGRLASTHINEVLGARGEAFDKQLQAKLKVQLAELDAKHRAQLARLEADMLRLDEMISLAFDQDVNTRLLLSASVNLARAYGVPENKIMHSVADVDRYILGR